MAIAVAMALALSACFGTASALASAPVNTSLPVVSEDPSAEGTPAPVEGMGLKTTNGGWNPKPLAFSYKWQRCNASGLECKDITGATSSTYTPTSADVGSTLVSRVTAYNEEGSTSATSKPTAKVRPTGEVAEYELPAGTAPLGIAKVGSRLYFTGGNGTIGSILYDGSGLTQYELSAGSFPTDIANGSGSYIWFANEGTGKIGRTTGGGTITEYDLPGNSTPYAIATGAEGSGYNWFTAWSETEGASIGKISSAGSITLYPVPAGATSDIVLGPDGNLWFTGYELIGKMTPAGVVTKYALPKGSISEGVTKGSVGELWFTYSTTTGKDGVGKITTSGTITEYSTGGSYNGPNGITVDGDGRPWFTQVNNSTIVKLEGNGTFKSFGLPAESGTWDITMGPDGMLWYTNSQTDEIGTMTP